MKKLLLLCVFLTSTLNAQTDRAWAPTTKTPAPSKNVQRVSFPDEFALVESKLSVIRQAIANAPQRFISKSGVIISLPNANGGTEQFEMFEASNFQPGLQAQFPDIRAYAGRGITDPLATV